MYYHVFEAGKNITYTQHNTWLFLHPEANFLPFGDQAIANIQCLCPLQVYCGVSVFTSQNLTVVSPEPLARYLEKVKSINQSINQI
jgi:hypothetical protein